jgi:hypothetical protein
MAALICVDANQVCGDTVIMFLKTMINTVAAKLNLTGKAFAELSYGVRRNSLRMYNRLVKLSVQ